MTIINIKKILFLFFCLALAQTHSLFASEDTKQLPAIDLDFCQDQLESLPILQNGRVKPLFVHAGETIKYLTGKNNFQQRSAVITYCQLSSSSLFLSTSAPEIRTPIEHNEIRTLLKSVLSPNNDVTYKDLFSSLALIRNSYMAQKDENAMKRSLNELLHKLSIYQSIVSGDDWKIPQWDEEQKLTWSSVKDAFSPLQLEKNSLISSAKIYAYLTNSQETYRKQFGDKHLLELHYAKAKLPLIAIVLTCLALLVLPLTKNIWIPLALATATVLTQITLITLRIIISGRAPVTNMYETVLFSGLASLILALVIGHFKKEKSYLLIGLFYNFLTLLMLNFAHGMLSASIGPLVPVLRDNFWLSTHVTSVIVSYGALALSWLMANLTLIENRKNPLSRKALQERMEHIYSAIKVGVVLLAAGVILGGVWADYSWGRFWGWDPKETWSLIVLCVYMVILHGKNTSWIPPHRFVPLVAGAFLSVMMAWFGVNYILATGLHSYGFSQGGAIFLAGFFALQIIILLVTAPNLKGPGENPQA